MSVLASNYTEDATFKRRTTEIEKSDIFIKHDIIESTAAWPDSLHCSDTSRVSTSAAVQSLLMEFLFLLTFNFNFNSAFYPLDCFKISELLKYTLNLN